MASNPTKTVGFFYDSHNKNKNKPWATLTFNAEESPLVSKEAITSYARDFGKESDVYRVRVLGEFPLQDDNTLIPRNWIHAAVEREAEYVRPDIASHKFDAVGVDVARYGENFTCIAAVRGIHVVAVKKYQKQNTMVTAGIVVGLARRMNPNNIKIDSIGVGGGVVDRVQEQGYNVTGVDVSQPAVNKQDFANLRAEIGWNLRKMFESGNISLKPLTQTMEKADLDELIDQLASIRYEYTSGGKILLWSKERMRREGLKSPDMADAVMLAFADYEPTKKKRKPPTEAQLFIKKMEMSEPDYEFSVDNETAIEYWNKKGYFDDKEGDIEWNLYGW